MKPERAKSVGYEIFQRKVTGDGSYVLPPLSVRAKKSVRTFQ
jgi:hypothetical protein